MASSSQESDQKNTKYTWLVILGLLFSSFGDFALALSEILDSFGVKDLGFISGLSLFLIGHLFYVAAFGFSWNSLHVARAAPFYLFGAGVYYFALFPKLHPDLRIPVAAYITVITTMAWRAAARIGEGMKAEEKIRPKSPTEKLVVKRKMGIEGSEWSGFIGAVIFVLSDLVLAINKFVFPFRAASLVTMILYYSGQLGIAGSVNWRPEVKTKKN